ncbi:MAG: glycosyltransferase [Hyphomonadaceae bacterium]
MAELFGIEIRTISAGGGRASSSSRLNYLGFLAKIAICIFKDRRPNTYYWCWGMPLCFVCWIATLGASKRIIFDDPDRLSLVAPPYFRAPLRAAEQYLYKRVRRVIVPGPSRYDRMLPNYSVLRNIPCSADIARALKLKLSRPPGFVVYVNGWLTKSRGAEMIASAIEQLSHAGISFVIAAREEEVELFPAFRSPNCVVLGRISPDQSLAWYRHADVVTAFYDPEIPINRLAEPNKVGDAIAMGTPLIMNHGVAIAEELAKSNCARLCTFSDPASFRNILIELTAPAALDPLREGIARIRGNAGSFEQAFSVVGKELAL